MENPQVLVSPLVGLVFDKLKSLIKNKFGEVRGVQKEMKKLSKTLSSIKDVLNDAEEKQVADTGIHKWLKELKDAAYKAEDVLEEWEFRDCQLAPEKVTDSLEELMESFDELAGDMVKFRLQRGVVQKRPEISPDRETGHLPTEPIVYGRDEDRAELVKLLCLPHRSRHPSGQRQLLDKVSSQEDTFICSIWGMGGLGKTTLAQEVYNDSRVVGHFQSRIWVCVSDSFDVARLIKLIIEFVSRKPCKPEALAPLQQRLQEELSGKRFLLVLDDVWDDNQDKWNKLKGSLACGAKGSCIIITTRIKTVSDIAGTHHPYELKALSSKACWLLFEQRAFGLENAERPSLVEIGKQIAAKCKGVPLAAKALGGLLRFENKESVWLAIRDSEIWELPEHHENDILSVLKLSYNHLSSPLKQCFAYCSIFPKDHRIDIKDLIHLWMANGFIQPKGKFDLEDAGDEIFRALLWRSLFQEIKEDGDGNMITCKMHDLVHDLACHMATNECLALDVENADAGSAGNITEGTRHLSLFWQQRQTSPFDAGYTQTSSQSLRSLISLKYKLIVKKESASFFFALVRLRVLDLHRCEIQVVPECIGEMIHLRYLNLSSNSIKSLPECIGEMIHLRYLNLSFNSIKSLPECTGEMIHLRYLNLSHNYIKSLPEMIHLRHLNLSSNSIKSLPECIGEMIHLRYLNLSDNSIKSLPECICGLKNLQTLNVRLCCSLESLPKDTSQMINLRQLDIEGCWGLKSTPNDIGKLVCLHKLGLFIVGSENGCSIKELQELNHLGGELEIKKLENVKNSVEGEEASLKSKKNLHSLTLSWSDGPDEVQENVTEVIEGLQPHPNLRRFTVQEYRGVTFPSWLTVSAVPNLVDITLIGCRKCVRLPPLGRLPLLKVLRLYSMDSVRFIDDEVYGESGVKGFPSLEELSLSSMPNLEGWSSSVQAATTQKLLLPCLKTLFLGKCPKLKGPVPLSSSLQRLCMSSLNETVLGNVRDFPCLAYLSLACPKLKGPAPLSPSLQILCMSSLNETELGNVRDLPCLSALQIDCLNDLVSFPEGALQNLTSLVNLVISGCKKLIALPVELQSLTTLKRIWIRNCGELVSLGERNPSSLIELYIENCPSLKRLPKLNKTCLERLDIEGCPELEFSTDDFEDLVVLEALVLYGVPKMREGFPEWLKQHATMIRYLQIVGCFSKEEENEVDLPEWIGTLTSLKKLWIHGCRNRKVLPEGLRNLTALKSLRIFGCNEELERRCEEDKGEDWFKIAHVPIVEVTSKPWDLEEPSNYGVPFGSGSKSVESSVWVKNKVWWGRR